MLYVSTGNLFEFVEDGHIIHGCNAQGVMGSGFAKILRGKYPIAYEEYRKKYITDGLKLGTVIPVIVGQNLVVHNAISQEYYGRLPTKRYVSYTALRRCLQESVRLAQSSLIESTDIHFPLIGGGLGGGDRETLMGIFEEVFDTADLSATLWLY